MAYLESFGVISDGYVLASFLVVAFAIHFFWHFIKRDLQFKLYGFLTFILLTFIGWFPGNSSTKPNRKFHTYNKKYYSKTLRTKQLPFKSSNNRTLSWHKDDNLVIRFSDDDSGTDSGDSKPVAATEKDDHAARLIEFKMPMSSSQRQEILHQSTQHGPRFMSKKGVAGPKFSSVGKINGSDFGNQMTSSSEKVEHIQKQIAALKNSIRQVHDHFQDTSSADTAVESLRRKISRENEFKVQTKTLFQNKDIVTRFTNNQFEQLNEKLDNQAMNSNGANAESLSLGARPTKRLRVDKPLEHVRASADPLQLQKHSDTHLGEFDQLLLKGQSGFVAVRSGLSYDETNKTLSLNNEGIDGKNDQMYENATISSTVSHIGLKDDKIFMPLSCAPLSTYSEPDMNSKPETKNDITVDASCNYVMSAKGPALLASELLDQSSYLAQQVPGLEVRFFF